MKPTGIIPPDFSARPTDLLELIMRKIRQIFRLHPTQKSAGRSLTTIDGASSNSFVSLSPAQEKLRFILKAAVSHAGSQYHHLSPYNQRIPDDLTASGESSSTCGTLYSFPVCFSKLSPSSKDYDQSYWKLEDHRVELEEVGLDYEQLSQTVRSIEALCCVVRELLVASETICDMPSRQLAGGLGQYRVRTKLESVQGTRAGDVSTTLQFEVYKHDEE